MNTVFVVGLIAWIVAMALAVAASVIVFLFKRPDVSLLDPTWSTLRLLRHPERFVRNPYARATRALAIAGYAVFLFAFVCLVSGSD
jgi:hypothetical protein